MILNPKKDIHPYLYENSPETGAFVRRCARYVSDESDGSLYIIGGSARDIIRGVQPRDLDLLIIGITAKMLRRFAHQFGHIHLVGKSFPVWKLHLKGDITIDITLITSTSPSTREVLQYDAKRRDYTINALSIDPLTGEVIDCHDGLTDITAKVLRPIDPTTFALDPIRLTRTIQLAGRLQYMVSDDLLDVLRPLLSEQESILPVRRREEYKKLFLQSKKPSHGLSIAHSIGLPDLSPAYDVIDRIAGLMGRRTYTQIEKLLLYYTTLLYKFPDIRETLIDILAIEPIMIPRIDRMIRSTHEFYGFQSRLLLGEEITDREIRKWAKRLMPIRVELWIYLHKCLISPGDMRISRTWIKERVRTLEIGDLLSRQGK